MDLPPMRRIVTGHDEDGNAIFQSDGAPDRVVAVGGDDGAVFHEIWNTRATPAPIDAASGEPEEAGIQLAPPANGTRIRVVDFPPDAVRGTDISPEEARAAFAEMGAEDASTHSGDDSRHAFMHRTETIDYGIILSGEITLILDIGERVVKAGDIVIQRGTNHGWSNHTDQPCRVAFVLVDGSFAEELA
ncbi:cupin domain-containing protein [Parasphingopyxis sp.]|uniref:cupin domain-containing protein n=1 Tax=Parasphingopyxis sp. TaxID=1920299 RepID=UPI00262A91B0|nr:cupin domain-containing protein [Parasphingopyxis sp.]